jgi:hypothetical protein
VETLLELEVGSMPEECMQGSGGSAVCDDELLLEQ